eukprot:TRINITY_DN2730_c0_g1_i1.p1 TRINITY_DN2730_c0_g1~~TRINITY_DN2730_c0_g1_i1.p1  ORF type:complete len:415 (+),score=74.71 TRINITY_DN2730_c0_g1_i1:22-1245(+)
METNQKTPLVVASEGYGDDKPKESWRNLIAFFLIGLINNYSHVIIISAAKDILNHGDLYMPTGAILLADTFPNLITKIIAPFFMHKIPYPIRVVAIFASFAGSFQLVAWPKSIFLKLLGVCINSFATGLGEVTFLSRSSYYHKNTVSAWGSGTGAAGIVGSLFYLFLSSLIKMKYEINLMIQGCVTVLLLVAYFVILQKPLTEEKNVIDEENVPLDVKQNENSTLLDKEISILTFKQRFFYLPKLMKYLIPIFLVYYAQYTTNQGIYPVLLFEKPFDHLTFYRFYVFLYQTSVFISKSSVNFFPITRIYLLPIFQIINMFFLLFQVIYNFIPYYWLVFFIIFWEGLVGGACYTNTYYLISQNVEPKYLEFSLGITSVADTLGIVLAGFSALLIEPALYPFCFLCEKV